jgi:hypothetical protein
VVRGCDMELYAASAREKAIACLSTDIRHRCNSKVRSNGDAHAQRRTHGIPVECLTASRRPRESAHVSNPFRCPFSSPVGRTHPLSP